MKQKSQYHMFVGLLRDTLFPTETPRYSGSHLQLHWFPYQYIHVWVYCKAPRLRRKQSIVKLSIRNTVSYQYTCIERLHVGPSNAASKLSVGLSVWLTVREQHCIVELIV